MKIETVGYQEGTEEVTWKRNRWLERTYIYRT